MRNKIQFAGVQFYGKDGKPSVFVEAHPDVKKEVQAILNKDTPAVFEEVIERINAGDLTVFNERKHWSIWNAYRAGRLKPPTKEMESALQQDLDLTRSTL